MTEIHIHRRLYALVIALVMVLATGGCSDSAAPVLNEDIGNNGSMSSASGNASWAVYWYLCGSDLESGGGFASGDLEELMSARFRKTSRSSLRQGAPRAGKTALTQIR